MTVVTEKDECEKYIGIRTTEFGDQLDVAGKNKETLKMTPKFLAKCHYVSGDEIGRQKEEQVWRNMEREDMIYSALSTPSLPSVTSRI